VTARNATIGMNGFKIFPGGYFKISMYLSNRYTIGDM